MRYLLLTLFFISFAVAQQKLCPYQNYMIPCDEDIDNAPTYAGVGYYIMEIGFDRAVNPDTGKFYLYFIQRRNNPESYGLLTIYDVTDTGVANLGSIVFGTDDFQTVLFDFRLKNQTDSFYITIEFFHIYGYMWSFDFAGLYVIAPHIAYANKQATNQILRPDADIQTTNWIKKPSGATSYFSTVNETTPDHSNGDSVRTQGATLILGLSNPIANPINRLNHSIKLYARAYGSGTSERITIYLYQGGTTIYTSSATTISRTNYMLYTFLLTEAQASNITDYNDLRVGINPSTLGSGESIIITHIELEIPPDTQLKPKRTFINAEKED